MSFNKSWHRAMGIAGITGGLILFGGDMMFYYHLTNTDLIQNMANASDDRIMMSGVSALIAAWLYMLGLGQIYFAFTPSSRLVRNTVVACFGAIFITYGVVHAAYVAIAATAKLAVENQLDLEMATDLAVKVNSMLRLFVYPIFALLSLVFIVQVWRNKTLYPRWILLFYPLIPFLLQGPVSNILSGNIWIIVVGGYLNLILVVFFMASTIALWNKTWTEKLETDL